MLTNRMTLRRPIWAMGALGLGSAMILAPGAIAQDDSTPVATPAGYAEEGAVSAIIMDTSGTEVGAAVFLPNEDGSVHIEVEVQGLPEGDHGIHIHETGTCDPSGDDPFASAGGHFNPSGAQHGGPMQQGQAGSASPEADQQHHAGDLGNITIDADGNGSLSMDAAAFTLDEGAENSLRDDDGSAIVIHENPDDMMTDPSGNSGGRIACGVIFAPGQSAGEDMVATPTVETVATPSGA
jgi:Cu-Zn family superoxide dismutase